MSGIAVQSKLMAKKKVVYAEGEQPLTFSQAIWLAGHTPHRTHKQIDAERKLLKEQSKQTGNDIKGKK